MNTEEIKKRYDQLTSARSTAEQTWAKIERFICPYRGKFFQDITDEQSVQWSYSEIYDSTAIEANKLLSANLNGNLTSPVVQWFNLNFRDSELSKDADAKEWLEKASTEIWVELIESGFNLHIAEAYLDITSYGNGFVMEEYDDATDTMVFESVPLIDSYFEPDENNQIMRYYRRRRMTPGQIIAKFGADKVPQDIRDMADNPQSSTQKIECVMCIYPREMTKQPDTSKLLAPNLRPFGVKWIRHSDCSELGEEGGYYEMPAYLGRWETTSDSLWGHGPSHLALPDVSSLNEMKRLVLRSWEKDIDPPMMTTERGLLGDLDIDAGGVTIVRSMDELRPLQSGANYSAVNMGLMDLRNSIREIYFVNRLDLKESPAMTATEVNARVQQMHKLIGPTLGRLQADLLGPIIERTFNIMIRSGKLPELPQVLAQGAPDIDIEFIGTMPMAQRMDAVQALQDFTGFVFSLAQADPSALDLLDMDGVIREYHDSRGVPASAVKGEEAVGMLRKQRAQAQAQQAQMQDQASESEALKNTADGVAKIASIQQ